MSKTSITQQRLRSLLAYDPVTGLFTWNRSRQGVTVGRVAGSTCHRGYVTIMIDTIPYLAHRLAWLYVYGAWPLEKIDHQDQNPSNNRINNLRCASVSDNAKNVKRRNTNTSGVTGVSWDKRAKKWHVGMTSKGKRIHDRRYKSLNEAISIRKALEKEHGFHPNHGT